MSEYKTFEELKEELGYEFENYMYKANIELLNIIKELRKYIKENSIYYPTSDGCQWVDQFKVLEILDKEDI